jgi:hypothetical protein
MDCIAPRHTHTHTVPVVPPFRQTGELAEGQESADVKRISVAPTPSAPQIEMAEGGSCVPIKTFVSAKRRIILVITL